MSELTKKEIKELEETEQAVRTAVIEDARNKCRESILKLVVQLNLEQTHIEQRESLAPIPADPEVIAAIERFRDTPWLFGQWQREHEQMVV